MILPVLQSQNNATLNTSCEPCVFLKACGGYRNQGLFNCFQLHCCGGKDDCDEVCPRNKDFISRIAAIHGLRFDNLKQIKQKRVRTPLYVPHLNHRYSRNYPLSWPIVSLTPYELFRIRKGIYTPVANTKDELRSRFHLDANTRVILRGTDKDKRLELYWSHRRRDQAPQHLANLGIELVIGPNFSHCIDVPRTDNLYNRKRQLICLSEMQEAGLNVAPHLGDAEHGDWDFWRGYIRDNPSITHVAKEFQTGNKPIEIARDVLGKIDSIQQHVGRAIHPILIGGSPLVEDASNVFERFTVLDSRPFMGAINRQSFQANGRRPKWISDPTLPSIGIDNILINNIGKYASWLQFRSKTRSALKYPRHRRVG